MNVGSINLASLLDLSARLNESNDEEFILNSALLSLMGKLRVMKAAALVPRNGALVPLVSKGKLSAGEFALLGADSLLELSEEHALFQEGFRIAVPVFSRERLRAVLCLGWNIVKQPFDESEITYIQLVCTIVANALHTSEYVYNLVQEKNETEKKNQLLTTLFEMSTELGTQMSINQILQVFSLRLMGQLMVNAFALVLKNKEGEYDLVVNKFKSQPTVGMLSLGNFVTKTIKVQNAAIEDDIRKQLLDVGAEIITPLKINKESKGFLVVGKRMLGEFSNNDIKFIESMGSTVVMALENVRLFSEELEKKQLENELQIASKIQEKLFPSSLPVLSTFELKATSVSSKQVGGDYFDCISLGEHLYFLAIADVSGKGMPASLLMANVQAALRALAPLKLPITDLVSRINDILHSNTSADKFVTFFGIIIDEFSGEFVYTNAGHNPPYLFRSSGEIEELSLGGVILGIMESFIPYKSGFGTLEAGDVLVLYTDGVNEAMDSENNEYTDDRLKMIVSKNTLLSAGEILERVIEDVKVHVGSAPQSDDITMMVLKRKAS